MNKLDKDYKALLQDILDNGVTKQDRTGTGTLSVFGRQIRHKMSDGFPLLTTKKMHWKSIVTELLWFLRGDTNIKYLVDNGCNIWNGDAYKRYEREYERGNAPGETLLVQRVDGKSTKRKLSIEKFIAMIQHDDEFANKWGELGPIYGKQWREWTYLTKEKKEDVDGIDEVICGADMEENYRYYRTFDQIANLINDLKTNPDSRRLMVSAWNVGELDQMVLPPCHYGFQVYTRELSLEERVGIFNKKKEYGEVVVPEFKSISDMNAWTNKLLDEIIPKRAISLMWNQRSVDTALGWPFNVASYGLLLELLGKMVNMVPDELVCNLGDVHLYSNHLDGAREQISREPFPLPKLNINTEWWPTESGECGVGPLDAQAILRSFSDDNFCKCLMEDDIQLYDYQSHPKIYFPLSN